MTISNISLQNNLAKKGLSRREVDVVELVATGLSNKAAADKLFVTEKTIKFHLTNIYKKLDVKSRAQLIVQCLPHMGFNHTEAVAEAAEMSQNETVPASADALPSGANA